MGRLRSKVARIKAAEPGVFHMAAQGCNGSPKVWKSFLGCH
jgi:hypothetical protein